MLRGFVLIGLCFVLVACSNRRGVRTDWRGFEKQSFDGVFFRAKADRVDRNDLSLFTTTVSPASASFEAARAAAEHEGIKYCIENFGTSRITWTIGPETASAGVPIENDRLSYQGRCQR